MKTIREILEQNKANRDGINQFCSRLVTRAKDYADAADAAAYVAAFTCHGYSPADAADAAAYVAAFTCHGCSPADAATFTCHGCSPADAATATVEAAYAATAAYCTDAADAAWDAERAHQRADLKEIFGDKGE